MKQLPRVAVIGTGGTISSLATHTLDTLDYADSGRKLSVDEVLAAVPETAEVARVEPIPYRAVSSTALKAADWMALRRKIVELFTDDANLAGIVILHGTASLEETAFFLSLTVQVDRPVVLVGAQRPLNAVGSDAPMNLVAALRVAGDPGAAGRGVLVVLNDEIHSARDVVKTSNYRVQTFRSPDYGMLGQVDGDGVVFARRPERTGADAAPFAALRDDAVFPRVDIIYAHVDADSVLIDAAVAAGAAGLVSAGFPPGFTTPPMSEAFEALARRGFPVVYGSRAHAGRVGARRKTRMAGFIPASDLSPQKARVLLMVALASGSGLDEIAAVFASV